MFVVVLVVRGLVLMRLGRQAVKHCCCRHLLEGCVLGMRQWQAPGKAMAPCSTAAQQLHSAVMLRAGGARLAPVTLG